VGSWVMSLTEKMPNCMLLMGGSFRLRPVFQS
jgi:hypothetical protein